MTDPTPDAAAAAGPAAKKASFAFTPDARRGLPGMPWKLGVAMLILGVAMTWDFRYRDLPGGPMGVVLVGPILAVSGAWILLWLPFAARWLRQARAGEAA